MKSKVKENRFVWRFIQSGKKGKDDNDQKAIYIKTESSKANELRSFPQSTINDQQQQIFGAQFTFVPLGTYPTNQQQQLSLSSMKRKLTPFVDQA